MRLVGDVVVVGGGGGVGRTQIQPEHLLAITLPVWPGESREETERGNN